MRRAGRYLETLLSCARQLRSGVTTVVDVHSARGSARSYAESVDESLTGYEAAGMRVAFATGQTMESLLVHGEDEAFIASLPSPLREDTERHYSSVELMTPDEYLAVVEERIKAYAAHQRIDVWFGPPGPQWVSDNLLQEMARKASALDTNIQTHCAESHYEMLYGLRHYGKPTVEHLRDLEVLSGRFSLAHGVWLKAPEIELLAETGAAVSHNPSSNLRLRAGIAPLNAMLAAGVTLGLGMDGTTLNEDEDMFCEMRLAMRLNRSPRYSEPCPFTADVFELATAGGAKLMRKQGMLGALKPGYQADLVMLDLSRITWPWVAPEVDPRELVLMQANAGDVSSVMVAGEIVFQDGQPTRFDIVETARALAEQLQRQTYGTDAADLVKRLKPQLESWYRSWEGEESLPYTQYNGK
jgi:cytosine/adenosine deaminase-related metal-dependent hydrolase